MGAAASIGWDECNEDLTEEEVKNILGDNFDMQLFNNKKDKDTGLLKKSTLKEIVDNKTNSNTDENSSNPTKIGIQLPPGTKRKIRHNHRSLDSKIPEAPQNGGNTKRVPRSLSLEESPVIDDCEVSKSQDKVDSWESVKAQPSCAVCGMVFSSAGKLDTHIKYSSVHVLNLKKHDDLDKSQDVKGINTFQEEETSRCRVLYTGSKHFWRTRDHLDITIYLHIDAKCLEVIAFDARENYEYPRLYFDENKVLALIGEKAIWDKVAELKEEANRKKVKQAPPSQDILFAEEKRIAMSSFVLHRLKLDADDNTNRMPLVRNASASQLVEATNELLASQSAQMLKLGVSSPKASSKGFGKRFYYMPSANDSEKNVDFDITTGSVTPVLIHRRRHSTDQEIKDAFQAVEEMQNDIRGMTERAEGIANKVHRGVDTFQSKVRSRNERAAAYSIPRQRWIFAIKRVLRKGHVKEMKKFLLTFGDKFYVIPPGKEL